MELDLPKPGISKEIGLTIENGFTDYVIVSNFQQQQKFPNVSIIINDIRFNATYRYKYGYQYGYGNGYSADYYTDDKKKK